MTQWFLRLVWKNMAVITRWSYKRGGRKAGFHCRRQRSRPGRRASNNFGRYLISTCQIKIVKREKGKDVNCILNTFCFCLLQLVRGFFVLKLKHHEKKKIVKYRTSLKWDCCKSWRYLFANPGRYIFLIFPLLLKNWKMHNISFSSFDLKNKSTGGKVPLSLGAWIAVWG